VHNSADVPKDGRSQGSGPEQKRDRNGAHSCPTHKFLLDFRTGWVLNPGREGDAGEANGSCRCEQTAESASRPRETSKRARPKQLRPERWTPTGSNSALRCDKLGRTREREQRWILAARDGSAGNSNCFYNTPSGSPAVERSREERAADPGMPLPANSQSGRQIAGSFDPSYRDCLRTAVRVS